MSISGKYLRAYAEGVEIAGTFSWRVEETADELDATVGADSGYSRTDVGVYTWQATIRGNYDIATGDIDGLRVGNTLTALQLFLHPTNPTPVYSVSEVLVTRSSIGSEVRGKVEFEITVKAQGNVVTASV